MDLNLINKVAIVCGSTQGIGRAAAIKISHLGASLVLVARNEDELKSDDEGPDVKEDSLEFEKPIKVES